MITLSFEQWEQTHKPIRTLDTHGKDWETVQALDPHYVFTVRDSEGSKVVLTNGVGYVDRLEYWEVAVPWTDGELITVQDPSPCGCQQCLHGITCEECGLASTEWRYTEDNTRPICLRCYGE